jgi:hypothetical protein
MDPNVDIIPSPPVVRERLAAALRQTSLLRRLLRLSVTAAIERDRQGESPPQFEIDPQKSSAPTQTAAPGEGVTA